MTRWCIHLIFFTLCPVLAFAQTDSTQRDEDETVERLLEHGSEDLDDSELLDELESHLRSRLNLNTASLKDLERLPFLSPALAKALFDFRKSAKRIRDWNQLADVPGMDTRILQFLRTFTSLSSEMPTQSFWDAHALLMRNRFQQDEEVRRGFSDGSYAGSRMKLYNRLTFDYDKSISGGVLLEKDPGETSLADHVTGHLTLRNTFGIDQVTLGDFNFSAGQGLVFWKSVGFSKGTEVIAPTKRRSKLISPYLSSTENRFLRGVAMQSSFGMVSAAAFYSSNDWDASIDSATGLITGFDESGFHRTETERRKANAVKIQTIGGRLGTAFEMFEANISAGLNGYVANLDMSVQPAYAFGLRGNTANMVGADVDVFFGTTNFFGEIARSHTGKLGGVAGITTLLSKAVTSSVLLRSYPADFVSLYGYAFGERNGSTQNENGLYLGLKLRIAENLIVQGYIDQFRFPNRTFFIDVPTSGNDLLAHIDWEPMKHHTIQVRYKRESKEDEVAAVDTDGRATRPVTARIQENVRVELQVRISKRVTFRSRVEGVEVRYAQYLPSEHGLLLFADVRVQPISSLSISLHATSFNTTSYDARLYQFESDVRGVMTNLALYGEGMRYFITCHWRMFKQFALSMKYAQTVRHGIRTIGSGRDEIQGDTAGRYTLQLDLSL